MKSVLQNAVLLLIDIQKGFDDPKWGARNNPQAEDNAGLLLSAWRRQKKPVIHIQHQSLIEGSVFQAGAVGSELKDVVRPNEGESVITKNVNSAFIGTDLEQRLRESGYDTLIIAGMTTPHCVSTTTRMAGNLGFKAYLVADATAAFDLTGHDGVLHKAEIVHAVSLATLNEEFATVIDTETVLAMLD
ncbi:MAG TPA: cysteine hydrolase family protein [Pyrinomonadaceae bacterium]